MNKEANNIAKGILKAVGVIAAIVLVAYFIYLIGSVIAYLLIAAVLALLGRPIKRFLNNKLRFPDTLAVVATMMVFLGVLAGLIALFIPLISKQSESLSLLDIEQLKRDLNNLYLQIMEYFGTTKSDVDQLIEDSELEKTIVDGLNLNFIPDFLNSLFNILSEFSIGLFSVLFITFFFLKDSSLMQNGLLVFIPENKEGKLTATIEKINGLLSRYFVGLLLQLSILFVIYTITLLIVGVENAIVIAFLCALFNIIPYIGPLLGGAVMITLTMTSYLDADFSSVILPKAGYVLIGITVGQLIDNFFSQPFIFSTSVRSHPLEIFLIIIIAGLLFGPVGMVVAVPGYTALKVILKQFLNDNSFVKRFTKNV